MSPEADAGGEKKVPPKLDLRRSGILKTDTGATPPPPSAPSEPQEEAPTLATVAAPAQPFSLTPKAAPRPPSEPAPQAKPVTPAAAAPVRPVGAAAPRPATPTGASPVGTPSAGIPRSAAPASATAAAAAIRPVSKKETSRIPLEAARPATRKDTGPIPDAPKTIKIKPTTAPGGDDSPERVSAEKRKTSRISLEAVLGGEGDSVIKIGETGPKTIRLKRPGDVSTPAGGAPKTIKIARPAAAAGATAVADEEGSEGEEGESLTRRKTVRVKRAAPETGAEADAVARPSTAPMPRSVGGDFEMPDKPNFVFPLFAGLGVVMSIIVIYLFCAQAFGPNVSLTTLSYGAPGFDLGWPGKITRME